ncbi:hypothetical protein [Pseudomonas sp. CC6-YY-74]|uniref:hypothetical protein n=1 Tax=Pseudomonas sp. CC6-YY-74 TaxID=1930532 RepID=UPI0012AB5E75|nr:hypothetical protein [Pseudomonas sp. CC6-YY-74]
MAKQYHGVRSTLSTPIMLPAQHEPHKIHRKDAMNYSSPPSKDPSNLTDVIKLALILLAVLSIWLGAWYWIDGHIYIENDIAESIAARGQFGDKFGAVNALFAGFAFAGIIFTIFLQNREIKQTKKMLEEQLKDSNKQRFDSTFFSC